MWNVSSVKYAKQKDYSFTLLAKHVYILSSLQWAVFNLFYAFFVKWSKKSLKGFGVKGFQMGAKTGHWPQSFYLQQVYLQLRMKKY